MLDDAVKERQKADDVSVLDISQILEQSMTSDAGQASEPV
jgi:hypothetical protein